MAPTGTKKIVEAWQVAAHTPVPEPMSTDAAPSSVVSAPPPASTPRGKTLVQKALEESGQKRRSSNHKRTADQVINKVIYDNFRSWNALQTDGIRVGGYTLKERLLADRRKVGVTGWAGGHFLDRLRQTKTSPLCVGYSRNGRGNVMLYVAMKGGRMQCSYLHIVSKARIWTTTRPRHTTRQTWARR